MMKVIRNICNFIPAYAVKPLLLCVCFNSSVYYGARLSYKNNCFHNLTLLWDDKIPVIPLSVVIYFGCYLFWIANYILISNISKERCYRFLIADLLGKLICGIIYIALPTTNMRPNIIDTDIFSNMLRFLYSIDAANNLFPSIHCLVSWYCYAGLRNCKSIPTWYRYFSLLMAIMICISTLTTKQHVIVDVIGGVILAEVTWQISMRIQLYKAYKYINREV